MIRGGMANIPLHKWSWPKRPVPGLLMITPSGLPLRRDWCVGGGVKELVGAGRFELPTPCSRSKILCNL